MRRRRPEQLADILEISKRTVYRYFILLEELGFVIDVDFEGCYFIPTEEGEEYQFTFNAEESLLIKQSINSMSSSHNLSEHILKKLHMMSEQAQIGENILNASNGLKIEKLSKAVEDHVQVKLINYSSLNSILVVLYSVSQRISKKLSFASRLRSWMQPSPLCL